VTAPPQTPTISPQRKQFLLDLFTTALEGGIGYWSECSKYHWHLDPIIDKHGNQQIPDDIDGFYATIHPIEDGQWGVFDGGDEDSRPLTIDLTVMERGARLMNFYVQGVVDCQGKQVPLGEIQPPLDEKHYYWQYVEAYCSNGDDGDYDAGVADMVVQFGLFGEVVYA
jgi:hypothetical protein